MRDRRLIELRLPQLWKGAKFIAWYREHKNPLIRLPLPEGGYRSRTVPYTGDELETFEVCEALRDRLGSEMWGKRRWEDILNSGARSVPHTKHPPQSPQSGIRQVYWPDRDYSAWVVSWGERREDGRPRQKQAYFSYGKPTSAYPTSEAAYAAALKKREKEIRRWYSVIEPGKVNRR